MPEQLDPVVKVALSQLTDFLFREDAGYIAVNRTTQTGAVHLFKHLKYHGHHWDPESVRAWALDHDWPEFEAQALSNYAKGVQEGVRYHAAPDPFGRHAYYYWVEQSVDHLSARQIAEEPAARYWFYSYPCEDYDYLYDAGWTTFPGRMAAYCPHRSISYRQSRYELPPDLPERTLAWVAGFLAGSAPRPPDLAWDEQDEERPDVIDRWESLAEQFRRTGWWPHQDELDSYYHGLCKLPTAPRQFDPDVWWPQAGLGRKERPPPPDS